MSHHALPSSLRTPDQLEHYLAERGLTWPQAHLPTKSQLQSDFEFRIPRHYADLIDWTNPQDPLRHIILAEQPEIAASYELADPIGDHDREVVPGLIHRYPDRALLLLTSYCLIHCRFCFRKEVVGTPRPANFDAIISYLEQHPKISEIIFSGGDPFTFPLGFLTTVLAKLATIRHLKMWRFHTRVPAVDPEAVSTGWLDVLAKQAQKAQVQVVVVMHIDHPRELTPETKQLLAACQARGMMLVSQTVLLKGVNDQVNVLSDLFRHLIQTGVKPYYLHHLDRAKGTHHFRLSIAEGIQLYQQLRGHLTTLAIPDYVLDLPGGYGKIPVLWLKRLNNHTYQATTFEGKIVEYVDYGEPTAQNS